MPNGKLSNMLPCKESLVTVKHCASWNFQLCCNQLPNCLQQQKWGMCFEKSPVLLLHFLQFISVLFINVSNAQVIYHQVGRKGDYGHHAVRAGELSFVSTKLGWASVKFRKYGRGTCVQGITDTVQGTTCFTAVNTGLNGFPCVAHSVYRIVTGQHCD